MKTKTTIFMFITLFLALLLGVFLAGALHLAHNDTQSDDPIYVIDLVEIEIAKRNILKKNNDELDINRILGMNYKDALGKIAPGKTVFVEQAIASYIDGDSSGGTVIDLTPKVLDYWNLPRINAEQRLEALEQSASLVDASGSAYREIPKDKKRMEKLEKQRKEGIKNMIEQAIP